MKSITLLALLLLSGCGEAWDRYDKPVGDETEWHRCMRQHDPAHRFECRDLK